jgi:uncharacterized low-complexity protein
LPATNKHPEIATSEETMTEKTRARSVVTVIGAALAGALWAVNPAAAAENPFAAQQPSGHMVVASSGEGGEGKCDHDKSKAEGKCDHDKSTAEGKCDHDKSSAEAKCGDGKDTKEAKCSGE